MIDNIYIILLILSVLLALKVYLAVRKIKKLKKIKPKIKHEGGALTPSLCYEGEIYGII